jgi:GTPase SAR1 family protein
LQQAGEKDYLNILLLGETGVGKSTWINALINYLSYETLEEARQGKPVSVIPSTFTFTDDRYEEHTISYGADANEQPLEGQSSTQMPRSYLLETKNPDTKLCVIDTPGIGDTRGIEKDRENLQNILTHLGHYEELHGIVILLKPNNARLTILFRFCLKELLTHLHRSARNNMFICFTNSRGSFYRPGDTMTALKSLLRENTESLLDLTSRDIVYCMDNEPIRYLMALKQGFTFSDEEVASVESSWKKSAEELRRLIKWTKTLKPHRTSETISLNEVRRCILALNRPLVEICKLIDDNIDTVEKKLREGLGTKMKKRELKNTMCIPVLEMEATEYERPRTVCTSKKCSKVVVTGNKTKISYETTCCECNMVAETNQIGCPSLKYCWIMYPDGKCKTCGCSWTEHMYITYETVQIDRQFTDKGFKEMMNETNGKQEAIRMYKKDLEKRLKQLKFDKRHIVKTSALFAHFLKENSIIPFNNVLLEYLDHQIANAASTMQSQRLEKLRADYEEESQMLTKPHEEDYRAISAAKEDVYRSIAELKFLSIAGPMFETLMTVSNSAEDNAVTISEFRVALI